MHDRAFDEARAELGRMPCIGRVPATDPTLDGVLGLRGADFSIAVVSFGFVGKKHSPKALSPTSGLSAVLGRNALAKPGDCDQARRSRDDTEASDCQAAICCIRIPLERCPRFQGQAEITWK